METIIVYVDDAAHAAEQLTALCSAPDATGPTAAPGASGAPGTSGASVEPGPQRPATHWVLVACAPRMTHRISKWVSHSARENWRTKWSDKLFAGLSPQLRQRGDRVTELIAKGPLAELSARLSAEHDGARVLDARRPRLGHDLQPLTPEHKPDQPPPWTLPGAIAGIGMLFMLVAE